MVNVWRTWSADGAFLSGRRGRLIAFEAVGCLGGEKLIELPLTRPTGGNDGMVVGD